MRALLLRAAAALAAAMAGSTAAQETGGEKLISTPAEKFAIAPGGVDMRTGRYAYSQTDLAIGDEGAALALTRIMSADVPGHAEPFGNLSHNWDVMLSELRLNIDHPEAAGNDYRVYVHFGGRSQTYQSYAYSLGFEQLSDSPYAPLTFAGDKASASVVYTYAAADGTAAVFRPLGNGDCSSERRCAFISEITEPDGTKLSFDYAASGATAGGTARLRRVTSSRGYALLLEGSGHRVTKACVINLAQAPAPANGLCPADAAATASYGYTSFNGWRLAGVTAPDGATATFTYADATTGTTAMTAMGFVKPGQAAPWLTNRLYSQMDEEWVAHEIVARQDFADGQSYRYDFTTGPAVNDRPPPLAGGLYTDALNRQTGIHWDWPVAPGYNHPGSACNPPNWPCPPPQPLPDPAIVYQQTRGPVEIVDPLDRATIFDYCDAAAMAGLPATEQNRCIVLRLQSFTTPDGLRTNLEYDGKGNINRVTRHARANSGLAAIITSAVYDTAQPKSHDKPLSVTDARNNTTHYTYAPEHGGVLTETGPAVNPGSGSGAGSIAPQKRYAYAQRTAWVSNGAGGYAPAGPPVWVPTQMSSCRSGAPAAGGGGCALAGDEVVTVYDYGPDTGPSNLLLRGRAVTADGTTLRSCYGYDARGRRISETSANANLAACPAAAPAGAAAHTSATRYDAAGRVTGTIAPDPDGAGPLAFAAVRHSYDPAGRLIKVEQGQLAAWQSEAVAPAGWAGFAISTTLDTQYDALDRKTREAASGGGATMSVAEYGYDLAGRLQCTVVRMNPAAWAAPLPDKCVPGAAHPVYGPDRVSQSVYDAAGQLVEARRAVGTSLAQTEAAYQYDGGGRKTSLTDARGHRAEMSHDGHGRQSRWTFPSNSPGLANPNDYEEYGYDPAGNRTSLRKRSGAVIGYQYDGLNRLIFKDVPEAGGDVAYAYDLRDLQIAALYSATGLGVVSAYDGFGRQISTTTNLDGTSRTYAFQYDAAGNRTRVAHPDGPWFDYGYDALGRMTTLKDSAGATLVTLAYDAAGNRDTATYANGVTTRYDYDAVGRLASLVHDLGGSATTHDVTFSYAYNPASQIVSRAITNDLYVFTRAAASTGYGVNGLNQYTQVDGGAVGHDATGNLVSEGGRTLGYDSENRLVSAASSAGGAPGTLGYDPQGRMRAIFVGGNVIGFDMIGTDIVALRINAGAPLERYAFAPGVDEPMVGYDNAGARSFYHADGHGNVVAVSNAAGSAARTIGYDEYGRPTTFGSRFLHAGKTHFGTVNAYYNNARFYDYNLGRFLQTDPVGYDDQINLYAYVGNDPVNGTDPTGLQCTGSRIEGSNGNCPNGATTTQSFVPIAAARAAPAAAQAAAAGTAASAATATVVVTGPLLLSGDTPRHEQAYITYTKRNEETGEVYSGRSSMRVPTGTPLTRELGQRILNCRECGHHMNARGFGPASLDRMTKSYFAIRGREQQLINHFGGARSMGGTSSNAINGISLYNPLRSSYMNSSTTAFGYLQNNSSYPEGFLPW